MTRSFFVSALAFFAAALTAATPAARAAKSDPPEGWKLVFQDDFEDGDAEGWEATDASAWKVTEDKGGKVYALFGKSDYKPKVRSPYNISLVKGLDLGDFVLEVRLRSTTGDYNHRDLCVFFNHEDPSHFYYVHFGLKSDDHSNSIFLVNDKPRVSIAKARPAGTRWSEEYHTVRIVRRAEAGSIEVYFDDMDKPAMTAEDRTFTGGTIGVGSFDDTGNADDIKVWAPAGEK